MTETDTIRDTRLQLLELSETIEELNKTTAEYEQTHTQIVEEKWEDTKDKALSNATKRSSAVKARLAEIPEYVEIKTELESLRKHKARLDIELDFMLRLDRKERIKTDITLAEALSMLLQKVD